jgi:hypothetical protein
MLSQSRRPTSSAMIIKLVAAESTTQWPPARIPELRRHRLALPSAEQTEHVELSPLVRGPGRGHRLQSEAGIASAVNNAVARVAGLIATVAIGALVGAQFSSSLDHHVAGQRLTPGGHAGVAATNS